MAATKWVGTLVLAAGAAAPLLPSKPAEARQEAGSTIQIGLVRSLFRDAPSSTIRVLSRPLRRDGIADGTDGRTGRGWRQFRVGRQTQGRQGPPGRLPRLRAPPGAREEPRSQAAGDCRLRTPPVRTHTSLSARTVGCRVAAISRARPSPCRRMSREHCHLYLARCCPGGGIETDKFFSRVSTPSSARRCSGRRGWPRLRRRRGGSPRPGRVSAESAGAVHQLRAPHQSEPFPAAVVAYQEGSLYGAPAASATA